MRLQGKLLNWNDEKGFGFVESNSGDRVFVHISAFKTNARRPIKGEMISYEVVRDNKHRYKASNVNFARNTQRSNRSKARNRIKVGHMFTLMFCLGLFSLVLIGKLPPIVAGLYLVMSLVTFIAYAIDKSAAKNGRWRTPEKTLHMLAILGGWPGALLAQNSLRHKSSKREFKRISWAMVLLNVACLFWLLSEKGISFS